jgi:hypothetical protein
LLFRKQNEIRERQLQSGKAKVTGEQCAQALPLLLRQFHDEVQFLNNF